MIGSEEANTINYTLKPHSPYKQFTQDQQTKVSSLIETDDFDKKSTFSKKENIKLGLKYCFFSQIFFLLSSIHIKVVCGEIDLPSSFVFSMFRQFGTGVASFLFYYYNTGYVLSLNESKLLLLNHKRSSLKWMIFRCFLLFFGVNFAVFGIVNTKQISYSLIMNTTPILNNLIAPFIIGHKFKSTFFYVTIIAFIGVIFMVYGGYNSSNDNHHNSILGFISVFIFSLSILFTNFSLITLGKDYDSFTLLYISSVFSFLLGLISNFLLFGLSFLFTASDSILNGFVNGLIMFLAINFLFSSFKHAEIQKVLYVSYIQIPLLAVFGYFYADETLSFFEVFGGMILLSSIVYTYKYLS